MAGGGAGKTAAMSIEAGWRGVRNGRRRVVRLQRRLWLAELALWPTGIAVVALAGAGGWLLWQRKSRARRAETAAPAPVDAPEPAVAGPGS